MQRLRWMVASLLLFLAVHSSLNDDDGALAAAVAS